MDIKIILENFHKERHIPDEILKIIENERAFRLELIEYFRIHKDREFVIHLLDKMISIRRIGNIGLSGDSLMLASYILGFHNQIEDCLKIWEAKTIDFDTFCYVDIQLVPFSGVNETIDFLKNNESDKAANALEYIIGCRNAGDFDDLDNYFSTKTTPWFV